MDNIIVQEAELWIGAKWRHGQALRGDSTDCIQWVVLLGKKINKIPQSYRPPRYTRDWALHNDASILEQEIKKFCFRVDVMQMQSGDILLFHYGKTSSHAGIYVGNRTNRFIQHIKNGRRKK